MAPSSRGASSVFTPNSRSSAKLYKWAAESALSWIRTSDAKLPDLFGTPQHVTTKLQLNGAHRHKTTTTKKGLDDVDDIETAAALAPDLPCCIRRHTPRCTWVKQGLRTIKRINNTIHNCCDHASLLQARMHTYLLTECNEQVVASATTWCAGLGRLIPDPFLVLSRARLCVCASCHLGC